MAAQQPKAEPKVVERVGRGGRVTIQKSYAEEEDDDVEFLMSESEEEEQGSYGNS